MKRIQITLTAAVGIAALSVAEAALTAKSYVRDGLVAHYDGIENVAYGAAHAATATVWTDLTGNGQDIPVPEGAVFTNGCALATGRVNGSKLTSDAQIRAAFLANRFTFEAAYRDGKEI